MAKTIQRKRAPTFNEIDDLLLDARATDVRLRNKEARDAGTCVLMAGIVVKDPASYQHITLVHAPFQGESGSFEALEPVLKDLQRRYPQFDIAWYGGMVD